MTLRSAFFVHTRTHTHPRPPIFDGLCDSYGGQEAGHGATDVMFGSVSPSARLPVTVYEEGYLGKVGNILDYSTTSGVGRTYR
jgi:hypothetical protein